jgi:tight adherence protein B
VVHRVLGSVAAGARLGARVPALLEQHARTEPAIADELRRLAAAWAVAERHGIALADLVDAVRTDLDARARLAGQVKAQLAGPRSTAAVLAGLPPLGVLLGQGIGANPWRVLTDTSVGQILLVVGTALACAGVAWSGQITARAVPR